MSDWLFGVPPPENERAPREVALGEALEGTHAAVEIVDAPAREIKARPGATADEWSHFDLVLGLTRDLLPVVQVQAPISPHSTMKAIGKTPSRFSSQGVVGFPKWTQHVATGGEVAKWSSDPRLGICVQTREVRAIDGDIHDEGVAARIQTLIAQHAGPLPRRHRANSPKFLCAFRYAGQLTKRVIKTAHGNVELLGDGQQFVACGTHTSGARYEWAGGLPDEIPTLTLEQVDALWRDLQRAFGVASSAEWKPSTRREQLSNAVRGDEVAQHLINGGWVKSEGSEGKLHIRCPFEDEHEIDSSESSTTYFPRSTGGYTAGHFKCLHAPCEGRTDADFKRAIGFENVANDFEGLRFEFESADIFATRSLPGWIVQDVIPDADLGCIYGPPGSGKTFFVFDLVAHVAQGLQWREQHVERRNVGYVVAEGAGGFRKRLRAFSQHHGIQLGDTLKVMAVPPNLMESDDIRDLVDAIKAAELQVVVIDTLAASMAGGDENTGKDMGRVIDNCKALRRATGAMVILVHHSGKDAARGARGWSGIRAALDFEIEVTANGDQREAVVTKQKDGEEGQRFGFRLQRVVIGQDARGQDVHSCVVMPAAVVQAAKREPRGKHQRLVLGVLKGMVELAGGDVAQADLVQETSARLPDPPAGRERDRERRVRDAITSLAAGGFCKVSNGRISL